MTPSPLGDQALLRAYRRHERDHLPGLRRVHLRELADGSVELVAEAERADGGTNVRTQRWQRSESSEDGWVVAAAQTSSWAPPPAAVDVPDDPPTWRVPPGDQPLVRGAGTGPLHGMRVAVKDLFAVAGHRIGAGNPAWLAEAQVEAEHAGAVAALLAAGADVAGIAQTNELAFSLSGENVHYGAPINPAAPGRVTGGSSSGPVSAVAAGRVEIGLGTDTAGSIRVPASYCGVYGIRTTHDVVDRSGLVGLAPSFDSVGVFARTPDVLAAAAEALLPDRRGGPLYRQEPAWGSPTPIREVLVAATLMELAEPETRVAVEAALRALALRLDLPVRAAELDPAAFERWFAAFRAVQTAEAWRMHGEFVTAHTGAFEPDVEARLRKGAEVTGEQEQAARAVLADARAELLAMLPPGVVLAMPSASSGAPPTNADPATVEEYRARTLRLTCPASLAGLPAVGLPMGIVGGLPTGLCLVGAPGTDRSLLATARETAAPTG